MPTPCPQEFRDDVVAVALQGQAPLDHIAKDFGISEGCLHNWLKKADGHRPGLTDEDRAQLRELNKRNRLLEQENEVLRRPACQGELRPWVHRKSASHGEIRIDRHDCFDTLVPAACARR